MWKFRRVRSKKASSITKHYVEHKEEARELVLARLEYFNEHYNFKWNRVTIRNQRRCWGSCTSLKNLNFNYKIILLPSHLSDYIIAHELCHLKELNHSKSFWDLLAETVPDYKKRVAELRAIDKLGHSVKVLTKVKENYLLRAIEQEKLRFDVETSTLQWCESCGANASCSCSFGKDFSTNHNLQTKKHLV